MRSIDAIREQLADSDGTVAREQSYFAGARLDDADLRAAGEQDRAQRADGRARQIEATRSNLGREGPSDACVVIPCAPAIWARSDALHSRTFNQRR